MSSSTSGNDGDHDSDEQQRQQERNERVRFLRTTDLTRPMPSRSTLPLPPPPPARLRDASLTTSEQHSFTSSSESVSDTGWSTASYTSDTATRSDSVSSYVSLLALIPPTNTTMARSTTRGTNIRHNSHCSTAVRSQAASTPLAMQDHPNADNFITTHQAATSTSSVSTLSSSDLASHVSRDIMTSWDELDQCMNNDNMCRQDKSSLSISSIASLESESLSPLHTVTAPVLSMDNRNSSTISHNSSTTTTTTFRITSARPPRLITRSSAAPLSWEQTQEVVRGSLRSQSELVSRNRNPTNLSHKDPARRSICYNNNNSSSSSITTPTTQHNVISGRRNSAHRSRRRSLSARRSSSRSHSRNSHRSLSARGKNKSACRKAASSDKRYCEEFQTTMTINDPCHDMSQSRSTSHRNKCRRTTCTTDQLDKNDLDIMYAEAAGSSVSNQGLVAKVKKKKKKLVSAADERKVQRSALEITSSSRPSDCAWKGTAENATTQSPSWSGSFSGHEDNTERSNQTQPTVPSSESSRSKRSTPIRDRMDTTIRLRQIRLPEQSRRCKTSFTKRSSTMPNTDNIITTTSKCDSVVFDRQRMPWEESFNMVLFMVGRQDPPEVSNSNNHEGIFLDDSTHPDDGEEKAAEEEKQEMNAVDDQMESDQHSNSEMMRENPSGSNRTVPRDAAITSSGLAVQGLALSHHEPTWSTHTTPAQSMAAPVSSATAPELGDQSAEHMTSLESLDHDQWPEPTTTSSVPIMTASGANVSTTANNPALAQSISALSDASKHEAGTSNHSTTSSVAHLLSPGGPGASHSSSGNSENTSIISGTDGAVFTVSSDVADPAHVNQNNNDNDPHYGQVLNHRSGIDDYFDEPKYALQTNDDADTTDASQYQDRDVYKEEKEDLPAWALEPPSTSSPPARRARVSALRESLMNYSFRSAGKRKQAGNGIDPPSQHPPSQQYQDDDETDGDDEIVETVVFDETSADEGGHLLRESNRAKATPKADEEGGLFGAALWHGDNGANGMDRNREEQALNQDLHSTGSKKAATTQSRSPSPPYDEEEALSSTVTASGNADRDRPFVRTEALVPSMFYCAIWGVIILVIGASLGTSYYGTKLALEQAYKGTASNSTSAVQPSPMTQSIPATAPHGQVPTPSPGGPVPSKPTSNGKGGLCRGEEVLLEFQIEFDSKPSEVGFTLKDAGTLGTAIWDFGVDSFRSFTQFQRRNIFQVCLSSTTTYDLQVVDSGQNGLVSTFIDTPVYGSWKVYYDDILMAFYSGDCNGTDSLLATECGAYCDCTLLIAPQGVQGQCQETCGTT